MKDRFNTTKKGAVFFYAARVNVVFPKKVLLWYSIGHSDS